MHLILDQTVLLRTTNPLPSLNKPLDNSIANQTFLQTQVYLNSQRKTIAGKPINLLAVSVYHLLFSLQHSIRCVCIVKCRLLNEKETNLSNHIYYKCNTFLFIWFFISSKPSSWKCINSDLLFREISFLLICSGKH